MFFLLVVMANAGCAVAAAVWRLFGGGVESEALWWQGRCWAVSIWVALCLCLCLSLDCCCFQRNHPPFSLTERALLVSLPLPP